MLHATTIWQVTQQRKSQYTPSRSSSGKAYPRAVTPQNIISGFSCTGIHPLDRNVFCVADFITERECTSSRGLAQPAEQEIGSVEAQSTAEPLLTPKTWTSSHRAIESSGQSGGANISLSAEEFLPISVPSHPGTQPNHKKTGSMFLTSTAEISRLEEREKTRKRLRPDPVKSNKVQAMKIRPTFPVSSESEADDEVVHNEMEKELARRDSDDMFKDDDEEDPVVVIDPDEPLPENASLAEGTYVLVEYDLRGKSKCYFTGITIGCEDDSFEVSFLRKSKKISGKFVLPPEPEINLVLRGEIKAILPNPMQSGLTKRQKSCYEFPVLFTDIDIR